MMAPDVTRPEEGDKVKVSTAFRCYCDLGRGMRVDTDLELGEIGTVVASSGDDIKVKFEQHEDEQTIEFKKFVKLKVLSKVAYRRSGQKELHGEAVNGPEGATPSTVAEAVVSCEDDVPVSSDCSKDTKARAPDERPLYQSRSKEPLSLKTVEVVLDEFAHRATVQSCDVAGEDDLDDYVSVYDDWESKRPSKESTQDKGEARRQKCRALSAVIISFAAWIAIFVFIHHSRKNFVDPDCSALDVVQLSELRSCDVCASSGLVLPLFSEYENSFAKLPRAVAYFAGLMCIFMGMGIICDQFMAAIEEITSSERLVYREVMEGTKRKFRVKIWNATVANLTLMALGSSAPEIMLSATELAGNSFFSGSLGPSTIVGSAAFNLLVISAVCVSALPAPETKKIVGTDAFAVTAFASVFAYVWILIILLVITPDKVDVWEGVVTILMFPALTVAAFIADKGYLRNVGKKANDESKALVADQKMALEKFGKELPMETLLLLRQAAQRKRRQELSRASARKQGVNFFTGSKKKVLESLSVFQRVSGFMAQLTSPRSGGSWNIQKVQVGFEEDCYEVLECVGKLVVKVSCSTPPSKVLQVRYFTTEGTAKEGERFKHVEGYLSFTKRVWMREIEIPIIDDDDWQPDELFTIELADVKVMDAPDAPRRGVSGASIGNDDSVIRRVVSPFSNQSDVGEKVMAEYGLNRVTKVRVLNDDAPGVLDFDADEVFVQAGMEAVIGVNRTRGCCGDIECHFRTVEDSAVAGKDYKHVQGRVRFRNGQTHKRIKVKVLHSEDRPEERFKLILSDPSPGVTFDPNTDGGTGSARCDVVIGAKGDSNGQALFDWLFNFDLLEKAYELWEEQFQELFYCEGSAEDQADAGILSWSCHIFALIWKILFTLVPPPCIGGGWPCFCVALLMIGFVTALAGDISSLLGCCIGLPDDVTAITLVALGTSLPDTFASKLAAQHDDTADNAVGNVTGSNSVNVFLGLGISWTLGAVNWKLRGPTDKWKRQSYDGQTFEELFLTQYPEGGFFVYKGTLAFSIAIYAVFAAGCLSLLLFRRFKYGGELGGPQNAQYRDAAILICMWVAFLVSVIIVSTA